MAKYTITVEQGATTGRWVLQAIDAPGAISEVSNLADAEAHMREAISYVTGEPENSIDLDFVAPKGRPTRAMQELLDEAGLTRAEIDAAPLMLDDDCFA